MHAHGHTLTGTAAYGCGCLTAQSFGHPVPAAVVVAGMAVAGGWAIWPDMDVQGTAARSLSWVTRAPAYAIQALADHRGATHWALTTVGLAAALGLLGWIDLVGVCLLAAAVFLGLVWCEAGFAADDRPSRRRGAVPRGLLATAGTWLALDATGGWWWVSLAVGCGGLAHLAGDCLTRARFPMLAPFTFREVGGLGWVPPTPRGQRVTWQERCLEVGLWAVTLVVLWLLVAPVLVVLLVAGSGWAVLPRSVRRALVPRRRRRGLVRRVLLG